MAGVYHLYFGDATRHPIVSNYRRSVPELPQEIVLKQVPDGRLARLWRLIVDVLKVRQHADWALQCHDVFSAVVGSVLWKGRVIYDSHEIYSSFANRRIMAAFIGWLETLAIRWSTIVVFPSTYRSEFYDLTNCDFRIIENLYYPYHDDDEKVSRQADAAAEPAEEKTPAVFVYTGLFTPARAIDDIVAAFSDPRLAGCRLILAGQQTGYLESVLSGAPQNVEYIGELGHADVPDLLKSADAGFALYRPVNENNRRCAPTKIFEFLYFGVHVIASDSPYIREIEAKTPSGLLTALHSIDVESIVDACLKVRSSSRPVPASLRKTVCWTSQMHAVRSLYM